MMGNISSRRKSSKTSGPLLLVLFFAFNSSLLFYFLYRHPIPRSPPLLDHRLILQPPHNLTVKPPPSSLKTWPDLPSFLPWIGPGHRSPRPKSCEAYFGNGFSQRIDALGHGPGSGSGGWFRCFYSETLQSSICEGGNLRMDPRRIEMSRGGEELETVIGREEEDELPKFEAGAFQIEGGGGKEGVSPGRKVADREFLDRYVPTGAIATHTMRNLIDSVRVVGPGELNCSQWMDNPTLLVTRFEYANLFHTVTDWYSAYVSSHVANLPKRPDLVFVDGHCKAQLEQTWEALFSSLTYAKSFTGPVCFRHAILSPLGYETAMFKGLSESFACHGAPAHDVQENPDDHKTARLSEFGEMIRAAFRLSVHENEVLKPISGYNVLFLRREDYLAHPRHDGRVQSRLSNEQEVFDSLTSWAAGYTKCKINLINGLFAHMPMKDQVQAVQEASVVIGAHGAGLTHLVAATKNTKVLEIISSFYQRPHFQLISEWKGLDYHAINLSGSYAEPSVVIDALNRIMASLGC